MSHRYCIVQDEGQVRIVTLNRPEVLNALHADANDELASVWDEFAARDDLWVGIITGAGERAFSAGNDLKVQAAGRRRPNGPNGFAGITHRFNLDKPIIAVVMTFSVLFTFTDFQLIWAMTRGGPVNATHLMATLSYQRGIISGRLGEGAAIATAMIRSAPWNSGTLNETLALPSLSAVSGPDQKATGCTRRMPSVRTYWFASDPSPPPGVRLLSSGSSRLKVSYEITPSASLR